MKTWSMAVVFGLVALLTADPGKAEVLERARETGEFRIGFRADAVPFSHIDGSGRAIGYSVDLCREIGKSVAAALDLADLSIVEVEVEPTDRLDAVERGDVDILCAATTHTLERRQRLDFTLPTFVSGATLLYRADGPSSFDELQGQTIGALASSTIGDSLAPELVKAGIDADLVLVNSHDEGMERLVSGEFAAYFGDGALLLFRLLQSPFKDRIKISERVLGIETYGLAIARGDADFRLLADRTLSRLYRSGEIETIFVRNFGDAEPSDLVAALWIINGLMD